MQIIRWSIFALLGCLLAACSSDDGESPSTEPSALRVEVGAGPRFDALSRTETGAVDGDRQAIRWSEKDGMALWAVDESGRSVLEAHPFVLWHYNATFDQARFSSTIAPMDENATYTYYAASPVPAAADIDGTRLSYRLPAVQNGAFDGACDVMVARPAEGAPALREGDNSAAVSFRFEHKVHLLRFRIPESLLGEAVSKIELTFPCPVVGRLTVDVADPDAAPLLSEGSDRVTLAFDSPVEADPDRWYYVAVAPVDLAGGEVLMRACCQMGESPELSFPGRRLLAGHITPVALHLPGMEIRYTIVDFMLRNTGDTPGDVTLGEPVETFTLSVDGAQFDNGASSRRFDVVGPGRYRMVFKEFPASLSEKEVTVSYDSEHALVTDRFRMPLLREGEVNTLTDAQGRGFGVPWLLSEDFGGAGSQKSSGTEELSSCGLPGWGASRYEAAPGRLSCEVHVSSDSKFGKKFTSGRIDTPVLPLKAGTGAVNLDVSFRAGGTRVGGAAFMGTSYWVAMCEFGTEPSAATFPIEGTAGISSLLETFRPEVGGSLTEELPSPEKRIAVPGVSAGARLSWRCNYEQDKETSTGSAPTLTNKTMHLYIDDVKVSIAKN